jgi:curved DNA-binding protein
MQNFRNYYEILGVSRDTPGSEIKQAYRQLARRYHPDVNQGNVEAENKFKEINEAYEVLSDPERRGQYDKFGRFWKQQGFQQNAQKRPWGARPGPTDPNTSADTTAAGTATPDIDLDFAQFRDFNSFVDELMRRRDSRSAGTGEHWLDNTPLRRTPTPTQMPSQSSYEPPIEQEAYDRNDDWEQPRQRKQEGWGGTDPVPPSANRDDSQSRKRDDSQSRERDDSQSRDRYADEPRPADPRRDRPESSGPARRDVEAELTVPLEKAHTGGRERIRLEDGRMLEVNLPAAMVTGQRVRLRGQGIGNGDLYLTIAVLPHKFFRMNGLDLVTQVPITPVEAVLGGPIEVPTLDGLVKMNLPKNVKSGQKLRLGKKGYISPSDDRRGDQIVELVIQVPAEIAPAARELYEQLKAIEPNPRSNLV